MEIKERKLKGVYEISLSPSIDSRGFFMRTYDLEIFTAYGLKREWVQENHSRSLKKGTIRGLHFQFPPFAETKLVRCIKGTILDVFIDLRANSETFGQWDSMELSGENFRMVYIPRGFAHGFCTLTKSCDVIYKVDNFYNKSLEGGIIWKDDFLNIPWPVRNPIISEKDSENMNMKHFINKYQCINV